VNPYISLPDFKSDQFVGHLYVVTSDKRDSIRQELRNKGIETAVHYPIPDYLQPINGSDVPTSSFPHTTKLSQTVLSLPCYPELAEQEVDYIITSVNQMHF
jgi:dTDP-4-amino-4,6-dideoxygalactose transaminase